MFGYLGDVFKILRHSITLNLRKSFRGDCQDASDSGRALETRCGCVFEYDHPGLLRAVCPHLAQRRGEWVCGLNKESIRGLWLRGLGLWVCLLVTVYLLGAVFLFGLLRSTGAPVGVLDTIWPGRWSHVEAARGFQFFREAQAAMASGRFQEAQVAAISSYQCDPRYETGLMLAQLNTLNGASNEMLFRDLIGRFPEQAAEVRLLWARALLFSKDFSRLRELAVTQLKSGQDLTWVRLYAISAGGKLAAMLRGDAPSVSAIQALLDVLEGRRVPGTPSEAFLLLACGHREPSSETQALPLLPDDLRFVEGLYYLSQRQAEVHDAAFRNYESRRAAQPVLALYLLAHPQERWVRELAENAENPKSLFPILFLACMKQNLAKSAQYLQIIYKNKVGTDTTLMELESKPSADRFLQSLAGLSLECLLAYYEPDAYSF